MKMRRGLALVALLSGGALLAYGCGDDTTEDDGSPTTTTQQTTTTTTTTTGPSSGGGPGSGGSGGGMEADGTCVAPFLIDAGAMAMGDTTGATDEQRGGCQSGSAGEHVYAFTPTESGAVTITMTGAGDMGVYVQTDCADPNFALACVDNVVGGEEEALGPLPVVAGATYFIFVDGYDAGEEGTYTLNVSAIEPENMCTDTMDENMDLHFDCEDPSCFSDSMCMTDIAAACAAAVALTPGSPQSGNTSTGTTLFAGTCTGDEQLPEALYKYTPAQAEVLSLTLASATDQGVYVRSDCDDPLSQLACRDVALGGSNEVGHFALAANQPVTIFVDGYEAGVAGPFTLSSQATDITESEPNNTYQMANASSTPFVGYIGHADEDFISVVVTANSDLTVSTTDVLAGDCAGSRIDTEIQILDTDGTTELAFNDDIDEPNFNFCSSATATNLAAGTYFVRISASKMYCIDCKMPYTLTVNN